MVTACAVQGCKSNKRDKHRSFFRFPKDKLRCGQWIMASSRLDLEDKSREDLYKSYIICDLHFEPSCRIGSRLTCDAVPTLMLPHQNNYPLATSKQNDNLNLPIKEVRTWEVCLDTSNANQNTVELSSTSTQYAVELSHKASQTTVELSKTPRMQKLMKDYKSEIKKRKILEEQLIAKRSKLQEESCITPQLQSIIDMQKKLNPQSRGNRFTKEFKLFALRVYFAGPMAYRLLGKLICLPNERTLRRINMNIGTKISSDVMKCLESKAKHLKESEKYCVICTDEMSLKRSLFCKKKIDEVVGFHEIDGIQTAQPATQAFVVMARGIFQDWKQPLGYAFLAQGNQNYAELNMWLDNVILEMIRIGFKVVAFVSDQGSNSLNLASFRNVTVTNPYFFVESHKIHYIFDVPHLIKSLRNIFLKNDIEYQDADGINAVASWRDIKTFYAQDNKRVYRLAPKLTESHINPNNFDKKKDKFATQVFSRTVAAGMSCSIELGQLYNQCIGTVKLIELINNTFDILNSSTASDPDKYKKSFSGLQYQIDTLNQFIKFLNSVTFRNTEYQNDVTDSVKCINSFKISLTSIMSLREDLNSDGHKSVFTRRLNQDVVKNFFGSVRQQCGNCREPTPIQFSHAFHKLFIENMFKQSEYGNCNEDMDNLLLNSDELMTAHAANNDQIVQNNDKPLIVVHRTDYKFDVPEENGIHFVCNYLLRACHDIHKCEGINAYVKSSENDNNDKNPLDTFVDFIKGLDNCIANVFNRNQFSGCLGKELLEAQNNIVFNDCCPCFPNEYLKKLFIKFRIHNIIAFNNRLLKSNSFTYLSVPNL